MNNNYNANYNPSSGKNEDEDLFLQVAKRSDQTKQQPQRSRDPRAAYEHSEKPDAGAETRNIPAVRPGTGTTARSSGAPSMRRTPDSVPTRSPSSRSARERQVSPHIRQPIATPASQLNQKNAESTSVYNKVPDHYARPHDSANMYGAAKKSIGGAVNAKNNRRGKRSKKNHSEGYNGTALSSVLKALIYIVSVIIIGGLFGYFGTMIINDMFALVKSDEPVTVVIEENATIDDVADALKDAGIIRYPSIFKLYASIQNDTKPYVAGTYTITPINMSYKALRSEFHEKTPPVTVLSITIPEGYTTDQIIDLFVSNGIGTREAFVDAIQNYAFEGYWFLDELETKPERKYRLDGYLYPDTYFFYSNSSEIAAIYKLLDRFEEIFPEAYRTACAEQNISVDELITLASMIQKEAKLKDEYGWISSVFNNRLKNPTYETQGYLQSDATTLYGMAERKDTVTGADNEVDGPYNTYTRKGLPVGPISNPELGAITWALYPRESDYFYFVAKSDGSNLFARTAKEHALNILEARGS